MLDFVIKFLQKLKEKKEIKEEGVKNGVIQNEGPKKKIFMIVFVMSLLCGGFALQLLIYSETSSWQLENNAGLGFSHQVSLMLKMILLIFIIYKGIIKKGYMGGSIYLVILPILLVSVFLPIDESDAAISASVYLSIIFPLLHILNFTKLEKVKRFFLLYNIGFYLFLALNILLITVGFNINAFNPYTYIVIEILEASNYGFIETFIFIPIIFFITTYGIYSLHSHFDYGKRKSNLIKGVGIFLIISLVIFIGNQIPKIADSFYTSQLQDAKNIVREGGNNYDSFKEAKGQWFLERAFLTQIKRNRGLSDYHLELFNKLYDTSPEEYFGEKIADYTNDRRSFATNLTKVGEKADVALDLAEIENKILDEKSDTFPILETTYRFHLENETNTNQEVIIYFETPTKYSVISDLKLGLNLELQGQVAPRGAAAKVYEESLRKNIDPALIEKVGLNTYSLKVFPVTGKNNSKTRGKQLVQLTILTPIFDDSEKLEYSPKFSFINLKFNEESGIVSKFYYNDTLNNEDIVKKADIEEYLTSAHNFDVSTLGISFNDSYCLDRDILGYISRNNISSRELNLNKVSIFFDNSASIERNNSDGYYEDIFDEIKNYGGELQDVDLYSYNSGVEKILDSDDIQYWGNSSISSVIDYVEKNNLENRRIIIITDDDNFDTGSFENKNRNFAQLTSNQISVIKIGERVKKYTSEFNNILSATNGNIYEVNSSDNISPVIDKIFINKSNKNNVKITECRDGYEDENSSKIWAGYIGNQLLSQIRGGYEWENVARKQTELSAKYKIVNQFNSFIALETEKQQRDLDRYKNQKDKYDTEYDNDGSAIRDTSIDTAEAIVVNSKSMNNNLSDNIRREEFIIDSSSFDNVNNGLLEGVSLEKKSIRSGNIQPQSMGSSRFDTMGASDSLKGASGGSYHGNSSVDFSFSGKTNISFLGLILLFFYLVQFYSIFSFIVKYRNTEK